MNLMFVLMYQSLYFFIVSLIKAYHENVPNQAPGYGTILSHPLLGKKLPSHGYYLDSFNKFSACNSDINKLCLSKIQRKQQQQNISRMNRNNQRYI